MEWVEVRGKTVDLAVEVAMRELGIDDVARVEVEVLQEPERGFLGIGARDAVVRVKPKPAKKRRRKKRGKGRGNATQPEKGGKATAPEGGREPRKQSGRQSGRRGQGKQSTPAREERAVSTTTSEPEEADLEAMAEVVREFLEGLLEAFGLEGAVEVGVEEDTIVADVRGDQTQALVGPRGSVRDAIHELAKTVVQRKTQHSTRLRLDIAGYAERRRQALTIFANQLIDQVLEDGGELMLEPMSASDRKVIHDAVAAREGVRSYSEGEAPRRYVVISKIEEEGAEIRSESEGEGTTPTEAESPPDEGA